MGEKPYLERDSGGRWAIGRDVGGRMIHLIEGRPIDDPADPFDVLRALNITTSVANIDHYFPPGKGGRCPTLDLLELYAHLDRIKKEFGV